MTLTFVDRPNDNKLKEKGMKTKLVVLIFLIFTTFSFADNIRGINMEFVTIGNAGNPADEGGWVGSGSVDNDYRIGKYEVTNDQWDKFVADSGAPAGTDGDYRHYPFPGAQEPVTSINWYAAAQFCNYLTSGDKSKGVYQFSGNNTNPGTFLSINRWAAQNVYGSIYYLPTEDEWYKAAYYKPDSSGYSVYANGTDIAPSAGEAFYGQSDILVGPWDVGSGAREQNGTYDMMGNVNEWEETLYYGLRLNRGGSFVNEYYMMASCQPNAAEPDTIYSNIGFRVASNIPEPTTILLFGLGAAMLRRKQK
jgi:formylglycine-generating enzyme required for sulfatase activity